MYPAKSGQRRGIIGQPDRQLVFPDGADGPPGGDAETNTGPAASRLLLRNPPDAPTLLRNPACAPRKVSRRANSG